MPTFSHSRIETFRQCPRKYFYQYVARLKTPDVPEQIATFFGSRCHEALEWLYKRVMIGTIPEREQVMAEFNRVWEEAWTDDIVIREADMTPELYRALGEKNVGDYYDDHHPFDDGTTVAIENKVQFPLDTDSKIMLKGYVDRITKNNDGTWHVHDYKSSKALPTQAAKDAEPGRSARRAKYSGNQTRTRQPSAHSGPREAPPRPNETSSMCLSLRSRTWRPLCSANSSACPGKTWFEKSHASSAPDEPPLGCQSGSATRSINSSQPGGPPLGSHDRSRVG